ncbi:signal peptidase II [Candidatus Woesearchaeota archaeon]|nr:signal peptidase II [Candidatus Woesearchaeota archaeon]
MKKIKKKDMLFIVTVFLVVILDQSTKFLARKFVALNQSIPIIKNIFHLTLVYNTGASFGMFKSMNFLFILISLIVIGFFVYYYNKLPRPKLVSAFILAGVIGNLVDRIAFGFVVDFLDFRIWPVFNVADSCISVGVVLLVFHLWKGKM